MKRKSRNTDQNAVQLVEDGLHVFFPDPGTIPLKTSKLQEAHGTASSQQLIGNSPNAHGAHKPSAVRVLGLLKVLGRHDPVTKTNFGRALARTRTFQLALRLISAFPRRLETPTV